MAGLDTNTLNANSRLPEVVSVGICKTLGLA